MADLASPRDSTVPRVLLLTTMTPSRIIDGESGTPRDEMVVGGSSE